MDYISQLYTPIFEENKFAMPSNVATLHLKYYHEGRNLLMQQTIQI